MWLKFPRASAVFSLCRHYFRHQNPPNVVFGLHVFVCMDCAGVHREVAHKVKSISMHSFTKDEYELFRKGGNDVRRPENEGLEHACAIVVM